MSESNIIIEVTAKTSAGMVREGNEDNFIITQDYSNKDWILPKCDFKNSTTGAVMVVADGMGGMDAGEVASKIVVDSIREYFIESVKNELKQKQVKQILADAIVYAHNKIIAYGKKNPETAGMGSTIVMAWLIENILHIGWVGDSRCYICRNEALLQLSKDHSYVQSLVDKGEITMEQAFLHPEGNIITQSLGDADRMPKPDYAAFSLNNNDIILLCSDGLNGMLQDQEIKKIITANSGNLAGTADALINEANNAGGNDNITVAIAKIIDGAVPGIVSAIPMKNGSNDDNTFSQRKKKRSKSSLYTGLITIVLILAAFLIIPRLRNDNSSVKKKSSNITKDSTQNAVTTNALDTISKTLIGAKDSNNHRDTQNQQKSKVQKSKISNPGKTPTTNQPHKKSNDENVTEEIEKIKKGRKDKHEEDTSHAAQGGNAVTPKEKIPTPVDPTKKQTPRQ